MRYRSVVSTRRARSLGPAAMLGAVVMLVLFTGLRMAPPATAQSGTLYPDLLTLVPSHLSAQTKDGVSQLFFTNVIANLGAGRFQVLGVHGGTVTVAYQQLLNAAGQVMAQFPVSTFEFHPLHNHWHINNVADYRLRQGTLKGPTVTQFTKVTFCMIDTDPLGPKGTVPPPNYQVCNGQLQGLTNGWGDEYFRGLPGQQIPITGLPAGIYYLVSTADPLNQFVESNDDNNVAWVKIQLFYVNGNPQVEQLEISPCTGILCGDRK